MPAQTSRMLFGHPRAALQVGIPRGIDEFCERTQEWLGSATEILFGRTVLGAYAPFIAPESLEPLIRYVRGSPWQRDSPSAGLPIRRFGHAPILRACPACVAEQTDRMQNSTWLRIHQLPGVYLCPFHGRPLLSVRNAVQRQAMREWRLPHHLNAQDWNGTAPIESAVDELRRLSAWSMELAIDQPASLRYFDPNRVAQLCRDRLGVARPVARRRTDWRPIAVAFIDRFGTLATVPGLEFIASAERADGGFIGRSLGSGIDLRYPERLFALLCFAFGAPKDFIDSYA